MIMSPDRAEGRGRRLRRQPGLRRPVQVRQAGAAGPHRGGQGPELLRRRARSTSTRSSTRSSPTRPPAPPTCAPATSQVPTRSHRRRRRAARATQPAAARSDSLGYQGITFNIGNVAGVGKPAGARSTSPLREGRPGPPGVRAEPSTARPINKVVFHGQYDPACGPICPASPFTSDAAQACPEHDPAAGQGSCSPQAGVTTPFKVSMLIANTPDAPRLGAGDPGPGQGGRLRPASWCRPSSPPRSTSRTRGNYQLSQLGWSGRVDPDGNIDQLRQHAGLAEQRRLQQPDCRLAARPGPPAQDDAASAADLYGR